MRSLARHLLSHARRNGRTLRILTVTIEELGWSTYAQTLKAALQSSDDHEFVHLALTPPRALAALGGRPFGRRLPGRLDGHYRRTVATRRWIRSQAAALGDIDAFDVVHATPHLAASGLVPPGSRPALSVTLDATIMQSKISRTGVTAAEAKHRHGALLELERAVFDRSAVLMCMSDWSRRGLESEIDASGRTVVIPPAVKSTHGNRNDESSAANRTQIVFVGNAWERKGGPELLALHQERWADVADLHVCSAGAPADHSARNVTWHGSVPRERLLSELLPRMDVFAMPTKSDMSPWAVAEALGAGLPVVTTDVGGVAELVEHGVSGFLSAPGDTEAFAADLGRLVTEPALRTRFAAGAREAADGRLSLEAMADGMLGAWERALAAGRG